MQYRILPFSCNVFIMNPFRHHSFLCLAASCASVIQLNQVFASSALAFSVFETTVSRMHAWENALLHGIAAAFDVTNFRLAFYNNVYVLLITRINGINSPQFSGMFEFWFLDFCQSPHRPHKSFWRSFVQ